MKKAPFFSSQEALEIKREEAQELFKDGWTYARIGRYFGVQPETARRWVDPVFREEQAKKKRARNKRYWEKKRRLKLELEEKTKARSRRYWTREKMLAAFQEWYEIHGKPPTATEWMQKTEQVNGRRRYPTPGPVQDEFGSWARGLRAAGFDPRSEKKVLKSDPDYEEAEASAASVPIRVVRPQRTREEIIEELNKWVEENRLPPTKEEWSRNKEYPSIKNVENVFGTWTDAIKAAGHRPLPPNISAATIKAMLPLPRK